MATEVSKRVPRQFSLSWNDVTIESVPRTSFLSRIGLAEDILKEMMERAAAERERRILAEIEAGAPEHCKQWKRAMTGRFSSSPNPQSYPRSVSEQKYHCPREGCPDHGNSGPEHDSSYPCGHCGFPGMKSIPTPCNHYELRVNAVQPYDDGTVITCVKCQEEYFIWSVPWMALEVREHLRTATKLSFCADKSGIVAAMIPTKDRPEGKIRRYLAQKLVKCRGRR